MWIELCLVHADSGASVIARIFIAACLLTPWPLAAQTTAATPPLQSAERALVNALMIPDREAFRQLIAPDAVFSIPGDASGPDAIIEKWRPFLLNRDVTVALTIEASMIGESGDSGRTSGTLAIYGRTNNGMSMTPVGSFSIAWRLVDGQWRIGALTRTAPDARNKRAALN
jgi:ketosteroid isomerase-like protein